MSKPPFITSTLQQEASTKLNFQARKTMQIAQTLYEGIDIENERVGLITYMRTDSIRLSDEFINAAKAHIIKNYGKEYYHGYKKFEVKGKNIQDAHEAIRPSNLDFEPEKIKAYLTDDEFKLYQMIYDRALASLMSNAKVEAENVTISNSDELIKFINNSIKEYLKNIIQKLIENNRRRTYPKYFPFSKLGLLVRYLLIQEVLYLQ